MTAKPHTGATDREVEADRLAAAVRAALTPGPDLLPPTGSRAELVAALGAYDVARAAAAPDEAPVGLPAHEVYSAVTESVTPRAMPPLSWPSSLGVGGERG